MKATGRYQVQYIDTRMCGAEEVLGAVVRSFVNGATRPYNDIVFCCIGTERATGDSLGQIVRHMLSSGMRNRTRAGGIGIGVYGTLEKSLYAKNISETMMEMRKNTTIH